ncbi:MAG TPA: nuclear transport factor 2 family protein [Bradyrhizobium sp.]|nr:nuclear transport factor 2 family protein [Bradyrhizobium sp.]
MNSEIHLKTWNAYQRAWGPVLETEREELLRSSVSDDILYTDPSSQIHGLHELMVRIAQSQRTFTGAYFRNDSFLEHHNEGLFSWTMYDKDGRVFVKGTSFGRFGADGRLVKATGFFAVPSKKT